MGPSRRCSRVLFPLSLLLVLALLPSPTLGKTRTLKIVNACKEKLWMAYYTSVGPAPSHVTGWEAPSGTSEDLIVEESWGGRVWARTGCDFTADVPDYDQCETGGCVGGLECGKGDEGGTGRLPVTLAEFNLQTEIDHFDSSNARPATSVDGFNVPMAITNSADCPLSNCPFDLRLNCPPELQKKNAAGDVIGCMTDCGATEKPEHCCAGAYDKPETCPVSNIPNYRWWKDNCPIAYAFAYDEASGTALFTCTKQVDYTITFCPSDDLYDDTATLPDGSVVSQCTGTPAETVPITGSNAAAGGNGAGSPQTNTGGEAATTTGGGAPTGEGGATTAAVETKPSGEGGGAVSSKTTAAGTGGAAPTSSKATSPAATAANTATGSTPSASAESSLSDGDTILGMSKTVAISLAAVVVILLIVGIAVALYMSHKGHGGKGKHHRAQSSGESSDEDEKSSATDSSGSSDDGGKR